MFDIFMSPCAFFNSEPHYGGIAPHIWWSWVVSFTSQPLYPPPGKEPLVPTG